MFNNFFPRKIVPFVRQIMSKNMVEPERLQMTIWLRVACWISKATRAQAHPSAHAPTHTLGNMYNLLLFDSSNGFVNSHCVSCSYRFEVHFQYKPTMYKASNTTVSITAQSKIGNVRAFA